MRTKQSKANREARAAGKARQVRSSALGKLIIMLAVVAAIVFGVAIFFKVNTIEIQGNTVYSADQIIEASQIQQGDNLLTVNKALAVGNIKAALPYVEDVSIARSLPDGIIIQVRESVVSFAVMTDTNACWLVGPSGKALERIEPAAFNENPHINGLLISTPTEGEAVSSPTPTALAAALDVMKELDGTGLLEHIRVIDVEKEYDMSIWYDERYEIKLSGTDELAYKIRYLCSILDQLSEFQAGHHRSDPGRAEKSHLPARSVSRGDANHKIRIFC